MRSSTNSNLALQICRGLGTGGFVAALIALCAQVYSMALPYRISMLQERILQASFLTELAAVALAVVAGGAVIILSRGRKGANRMLGLVTVILAVFVFIGMILFSGGAVHSIGRW